jgi:tetratricopeptide (TPR) repeat protein
MPSPRVTGPASADNSRVLWTQKVVSSESNFRWPIICGILLLLCVSGCRQETVSSEERARSAEAQFQQITREWHLPSAEATGVEAGALRKKAAAGYEDLLRDYPEQSFYAAQALRSLGNIHAAEGNLDAAVRLYEQVAKKYPEQEWEVLQAWKSAGDLLWEAERKPEARRFYEQIVARFDSEEKPQVVQTIVRASKRRLVESH